MSDNPYESPTLVEPLPPGDLLKVPAWGCLASGSCLLVLGVIGFCYWQFAYGIAKGNPDIEALLLKQVYHFLRLIGFALLAIFVGWCLWQRRNRWTVVVASIVGIIMCVPGPLAAVVLLRMRRPEIWAQFDKPVGDDENLSAGT
jgi:hypothetical protein